MNTTLRLVAHSGGGPAREVQQGHKFIEGGHWGSGGYAPGRGR